MSGEIDEEVKKRALSRQKPRHPILTTQSQRTNWKRRNQVLTFVLAFWISVIHLFFLQ